VFCEVGEFRQEIVVVNALCGKCGEPAFFVGIVTSVSISVDGASDDADAAFVCACVSCIVYVVLTQSITRSSGDLWHRFRL